MNVVVCCPSYNRPKVETLKYLPFCKVYVDASEYEEYVENNVGADIVQCEKGVQGNVARVRNYILDKEFDGGADVVCLVDDDMQGIYEYRVNVGTGFGYERKLIEAGEFPDFLEKYSIMCEEWGFKLWGVNVNMDPLSYRHTNPFSTVSVILGPFCCHLKNTIRYDEKLPLKEDYDLAIQHMNKYRGVLRVNYIHYVCKQSEQIGGCQNIRNVKKEKEQFELLQKKWGSKIVKEDKAKNSNSDKQRGFDYNPIIKIPIKGV